MLRCSIRPNTSYGGASFVGDNLHYLIPHLSQPPVLLPSLYNQEFGSPVHRSFHQYPSTTRTPAIDTIQDKMTLPVTTAYPTPPDPTPTFIPQTPMTPDIQRPAIWNISEVPAEFRELVPTPIIPGQSQAFHEDVKNSVKDKVPASQPIPAGYRIPGIAHEPIPTRGQPWREGQRFFSSAYYYSLLTR